MGRWFKSTRRLSINLEPSLGLISPPKVNRSRQIHPSAHIFKMKKRRSRLARTEERRNVRRAVFYISLTVAVLGAFILLGLPSIARFAAFLTDLKTSTEPIESTDTTPPIQPQFDPITESTNKTKIEITGQTEPGATVIVFYNRKKEEVLANNSGEFSYGVLLQKGINTISAQAKDSAGNESKRSEVIKVLFDNSPPSLEITKPEDGSKYFGSKQRQVVIEGITEENASLFINERLVVVENDGSFAFVTTLSEGENTFNFIAKDQADNSTEASLSLTFTP